MGRYRHQYTWGEGYPIGYGLYLMSLVAWRSRPRVQRASRCALQLFDFPLPLPDLYITRQVDQLQLYLVEPCLGTVSCIPGSVDHPLEQKIRLAFMPWRFPLLRAPLLALPSVGGKLHLPGIG